MTDASIVIGISGDIQGGRVVKRTLDDIAVSGNNATNSAKLLSRTMQTLFAAFGIRQLQQMVDTWSDLNSRLRIATGSTEQAADTMRRLRDIARRTYSSLELTSESFLRNSTSLRELGLSTEQQLDFTEALNNALVISATKGQQAESVQNALSKAMALGKLSGENLNTVIASGGRVTEALATSLGVTTNELRQLGTDGVITGDVIFNSLTSQLEKLREEADAMPATIADAFTRIRNSILQTVGAFDQTNELSESLAKNIVVLSDNISNLAKALAIATAAWVGYKIALNAATGAAVLSAIKGSVIAFAQLAVSVQSLTGFVALLNATFLTGPFALVAALAAAGAAAYIFRDDIKAALTVVISEAIILIDNLSRSITSLGGLLGKGYSISGLSAEDLRGGANDVLLELNRKLEVEKTTPSIGGGVIVPTGGGGGKKTKKTGKTPQDELLELIRNTRTEQERLNAEIARLERLRGFAKTAEELDAINRGINNANKELSELGVDMKKINSEMDRFANNTAEAFSEFISGAKSAKEALSSIVGDLLQYITRETITAPLKGLLSNALGVGGAGGGLSGILGGGLNGIGQSLFRPSSSFVGPVQPSFGGLWPFNSGGSFAVGGNSGIDRNILSLNGAPVARVSQGERIAIRPGGESGGMGTVINQVINVSTGVVDTVRAEIVALLPSLQESTRVAVEDARLRGIT
jgi:tape measure domain-containing protein